MSFWNNLLRLFGLYTMEKSRDDAETNLDQQQSSDPEFCDVCQYPIGECICGKFKKPMDENMEWTGSAEGQQVSLRLPGSERGRNWPRLRGEAK